MNIFDQLHCLLAAADSFNPSYQMGSFIEDFSRILEAYNPAVDSDVDVMECAMDMFDDLMHKATEQDAKILLWDIRKLCIDYRNGVA